MRTLLNTTEMIDEDLAETPAEGSCSAADTRQDKKKYSLTVLLNICDKVRTAEVQLNTDVFSSGKIVLLMLDEIEDFLHNRCGTIKQVADFFAGQGVNITERTMKDYIARARRIRKADKDNAAAVQMEALVAGAEKVGRKLAPRTQTSLFAGIAGLEADCEDSEVQEACQDAGQKAEKKSGRKTCRKAVQKTGQKTELKAAQEAGQKAVQETVQEDFAPAVPAEKPEETDGKMEEPAGEDWGTPDGDWLAMAAASSMDQAAVQPESHAPSKASAKKNAAAKKRAKRRLRRSR